MLGAAVLRDGRAVAESVLPPGREHLEKLPPLLTDLLKRTRIRFADIDGLGVAIGPGSFSWIRVGMAVVKGIALALRIPAIGVSSLELLAWQGLSDGESGTALLDAGRGEVYAASYERRGDRLVLLDGPRTVQATAFLSDISSPDASEPLLPAPETDLLTKRAKAGMLLGYAHTAAMLEVGKSLFWRGIEAPSPVACAVLAEHALDRGGQGSVHRLEPLYVRRSDAEEKKRHPARA
jgi:tRNA threonylcarbamoyladenosine biosynthesis protein TsaB